MRTNEWTTIIGVAIALGGVIFAAMKFYVKAIMRELLPNSGQSIKDQVTRIEMRLDALIIELSKK